MRNKTWSEHWERLERKGLLSRLAGLYRKRVIAGAVRHYCDALFPAEGFCVDAGCGTGQASQKVSGLDRHLVGLDVSRVPLEKAKSGKTYDSWVQADATVLPFKNNSLDGLWNVGVMEHMRIEAVEKALGEFHRALKPGSYCVMFWPPKYDYYYFLIRPFEKAMGFLKRAKYRLYPEEVTNAKSCSEMKELVLRHSKFRECEVHYSLKDLFTHYVVICRK